ncbi:WD repeat-containing protein 90 [Chanos chanos]|uniref:WD repeat-containing protein 90 n=1 Tax=Chanos chanos TaxID=29144 RepID=A0A6J2V2P9_CHACN|nr:WD repeat-containing protein 90 [Chanos chanos]
MSSRAWQNPYVNVFKHMRIDEWKKASREGDVTSYTDKTLKCPVYRIRGSVPASNYILLPKSGSQSLGLTGRYVYFLFRPSPGNHFTVHLDVASQEGQVIRVSFSNLMKEFKATPTSLQFPFICAAAHGSVYDSTAKTAKHGLVGCAPASVRWTCMVMDLRSVLSVYLNKQYSHLKSVKLCSNMTIKNIMTSDLLLDPSVSYSEFRHSGVSLGEGWAAMPREMSFPVPAGSSWHQLYHHVRFPSDGGKMPFDSIQKGHGTPAIKCVADVTQREESRSVCVSKPVQDRVSLIQQITTPKPCPRWPSKLLTPSLPELTSAPVRDRGGQGSPGERSEGEQECEKDKEVCVCVHHDGHVSSHTSDSHDQLNVVCMTVSRPVSLSSVRSAREIQKLHPDPILKLNRIIGFGGATTKCVVWSRDGEEVVYPCHAIVVSMKISSGQQRFFIGHTDKVSALALNGSGSVLASVQTGSNSLLRLWSFRKRHCLAMINTHTHTLNTLSFSYSGGVLCGVGKDNHHKTMVIVWNTEHVTKGGVVSVLAKAHTDADVQSMKIAYFDDTRMVSCGSGNVRLWRVRGGSLRSCPVNLGQYHNLDFTDLDFEDGLSPDEEADSRTLFVSSQSGHILEINYVAVTISNVRRLLPAQISHAHRREKQTFTTGPGIAVNSISVCSAFCATGSEDGFLRLWPLDFSSVFLEAEHEGPVNVVSVSTDGLSVLAATRTGNLGYLDVRSHGYNTLMRSHTEPVLGFSIDGIRRRVTTASRDGTVRVWDMETLQQLYDFVSDDVPCCVGFHPSQPVFACGSDSGTLRVFDINTSSLLAQHRQHTGSVTGLVFSPDGERLYSACSHGYLVLYDSSHPEYQISQVLGNVVARGTERGPDAMAISSDGDRLAFVGPSEFTVTVMAARSLEELLRVDVSILDLESPSLDSAVSVTFSPSSLGHLLITTSANKILWIDTATGRLLREVSEAHKGVCCSLVVSEDGRYLLTATQNTVKVWDYSLTQYINSQVFIGHSEPIRQVSFTPDQMGVVSVGDALFFWDFLAHPLETGACSLSAPAVRVSPPKPGCDETVLTGLRLSNGTPRQAVPLPSSPPRLGVSPTLRAEGVPPSVLSSPSPAPGLSTVLKVTERSGCGDSSSLLANQASGEERVEDPKPVRPDCYKHFTPRYNISTPDQSVVAPPPGQGGLNLKAVIGYNGNGRGNLVWNPDTGLFVYSCGCVIVVENLHTGSQRHWLKHTEEISTLTATHDAQTVASAAKGGATSQSLICIWDVHDGSCRKSLHHHKGAVQSLAFSRDDRYFLSVGDYEDLSVALWRVGSFDLLVSVTVPVPLHDVMFCPSRDATLACVGTSAIFFCKIHTQGNHTQLQVQQMGVAKELEGVELTALCYDIDSLLYTSTNQGCVCVWDCTTKRCFMTWEADEGEIGVMLCRSNRLLTGGNSKRLRLWSLAKFHPQNKDTANSTHRNGQVLLEQELLLDGTIVSAVFDDVMAMGIVGTTAGTLWYINWADSTSIRLISGHKSKVNSLVCSPDERHFVTCGQDGSVRVWALPSNELLVQFQVLNQSCECVCWSGPGGESVCVAGGYSDGTVRIFSLNTAEMHLKLHPHPRAVGAIQYSVHGEVLLSGGQDGVIVISSPVTGAAAHIINDHKGAAITGIQCVSKQYKEFGLEGNELWLAVSADRRVSVWASDWTKDKCELLDWLTFPAPAPPEDADTLPPSLAVFSPCERGVVVYTGYAVDKQITFYCLRKKQVLRTVSLTSWALCLSVCADQPVVTVGSNQRVLTLIHWATGRREDFCCHGDSVQRCSFSLSGHQLFTSAHSEVFIWDTRRI